MYVFQCMYFNVCICIDKGRSYNFSRDVTLYAHVAFIGTKVCSFDTHCLIRRHFCFKFQHLALSLVLPFTDHARACIFRMSVCLILSCVQRMRLQISYPFPSHSKSGANMMYLQRA